MKLRYFRLDVVTDIKNDINCVHLNLQTTTDLPPKNNTFLLTFKQPMPLLLHLQTDISITEEVTELQTEVDTDVVTDEITTAEATTNNRLVN